MSEASNSKLSRREFVAGAAGIALSANTLVRANSLAQASPNILFILADDMGWGDLSCYGRPDYKTPELDRLATQGIRFTDAYSAAPVCTPTRVGLLTGRYPARLPVGLEEPIVGKKALGERVRSLGIPHDHPTLSSLIKAAGYDTALVGKWHLGYLPNFSPLRYGFDEFFGIMSGAGDYFQHTDPDGDADLFEGEVPVERVGYLTDLLTERAVEYVQRLRKKPFYLSLHYTSPHWPWEGPKDRAVSDSIKMGPAGFRAGGSIKAYAEMVKDMDAGIGKVLRALKAKGLDRSTLVIFTSDNGGERFSFNWPFAGQKMDVQEGGIRVPAIVRWPGVTKPGQLSAQPVITMDWTATMIAAAGAQPDPKHSLDGEDLRSVLSGERAPFDRTFFWRTHRQGGMRSGHWKYIREGNKESLFDLAFDQREQADFNDSEPETLQRLRAGYTKWNADVLPYARS